MLGWAIVGALAGVTLWFTGVDAHLQWWLAEHSTPITDKISRLLGVLGLGRSQMLGCLLIAGWLGYAAWPKATRPPLWQWPAWLVGSVGWLWLRTLVGVIGPAGLPCKPAQLVYRPSGLVDFSRMLTPKARAWLLMVPIMFVAGLVSLFIKIGVGRPRPKKMLWEGIYDPQWLVFSAGYWSFPSGHTVTTFAILSVLWPWYPRAKWFFLLAAMVLAAARVTAITPHFVGDILAGAALGYTIGWFLRKKYNLEP